MEQYNLTIELLSDALPGSGEGFGAVIDQDVVFDDLGIPYIPAKRIKGLLRDSYEEIFNLIYSTGSGTASLPSSPESLFGRVGMESEAPLYFSNLYIEDYKNLRNYILNKKTTIPDLFTTESVSSTFTYTRQQTAIDQDIGIALKGSLRTIRVLKCGLKFSGEINFDGNSPHDNAINLLTLACLNLKRMGTKRTRGFGEIACFLHDCSDIKRDLKETALNWLASFDKTVPNSGEGNKQ